MPRRNDIRKILLLGSGPIVIGQACEFDYSGTQGAKALTSLGYDVVLVNSNPATIMTDPELVRRTYIEPLTRASLSAIIERERPDALLPTLGGQTALNLALDLHESGVLSRLGVNTGDSLTLAPAMTLIDREYQRLRDASRAVMHEIGVETGGSNVQFAVDPKTGRVLVIEMNPRVSRSSALASKATGYPIAKIAAKLAVGFTLDELENDITGTS